MDKQSPHQYDLFNDLVVDHQVDDYRLRMERDMNDLALKIQTGIEADMASQLVKKVLVVFEREVARRANVPSSEVLEMLAFLFQDPELREKYMAYRAAKRMTAPPLQLEP